MTAVTPLRSLDVPSSQCSLVSLMKLTTEQLVRRWEPITLRLTLTPSMLERCMEHACRRDARNHTIAVSDELGSIAGNPDGRVQLV